MGIGLSVYDLISGKWNHRYRSKRDFLKMEPLVESKGLVGGFSFTDAQVDDARLVMRLILEAEASGGVALNYTRAIELIRGKNGKIEGLVAKDTETDEIVRIHAPCVVNATGVWAENIHPSPEKNKHIRPLRGSHLVFPENLIPIKTTVSFFNPEDGRALFAIPWEGAVIVGTTDLDHGELLSAEPRITAGEAEYLLKSLNTAFPSLKLSLDQAVSSFAGVRPVVSEGSVSADKESRDHVIWKDNGLVTVTGGKLTTFRVLAYDTLKSCIEYLPGKNLNAMAEKVFEPKGMRPSKCRLTDGQFRTLWGRYGKEAMTILSESSEKDLETISGTRTLWAEIRHAARHEKVRHLDDLLLRRVRIGLLLSNGGNAHMERIRDLCDKVLPWDDARWKLEQNTYIALCKTCYSPISFEKKP
jgi:glycerol-3-phosphate dehydrogenase